MATTRDLKLTVTADTSTLRRELRALRREAQLTRCALRSTRHRAAALTLTCSGWFTAGVVAALALT
ncbi:MAG TPA: hypothetical protein VFZ00_28380 [Solirubrobacter sp.]|nr:hypothetical protein [Solirubrobacter sp.]